MNIKNIFASALSVLMFTSEISALASPAVFTGEFWQTPASSNVNVAIAATGGTPSATFESTHVDYPQGAVNTQSSNNSLSNFLGSDGSSIVGNSSAQVRTSVFKFSGFIELTSGSHTFSVGSDDGFRLYIDGNQIIQHSNPRGFRFTTGSADIGSGVFPFELYFYENHGNTGVEFFIDGALAEPAPKADIVATKKVRVHSNNAVGCGVIVATPIPAAAAATPGSCLEYNILMDNSGPGTSYGTTMEDILGPDMIFSGATYSGFNVSDPDFEFETPAIQSDCASVSCIVAIREAIIPPGSTGIITIRAVLK